MDGSRKPNPPSSHPSTAEQVKLLQQAISLGVIPPGQKQPFPPPAPQPDLTDGSEEPIDSDLLQKNTFATYTYATLAGSLGTKIIDPASLLTYRDEMLSQCGAPRDPVEVMLLEQFLLAHHAAGCLHTRGASTQDARVAVAYIEAGGRLMAECRRMALALQQYRAGAANRLRVVRGNRKAKSGRRQRRKAAGG